MLLVLRIGVERRCPRLQRTLRGAGLCPPRVWWGQGSRDAHAKPFCLERLCIDSRYAPSSSRKALQRIDRWCSPETRGKTQNGRAVRAGGQKGLARAMLPARPVPASESGGWASVLGLSS